ncbi:MAG: XdhC family protein [Candidatus Eisenbacteria sp.]|nr:XdhC family protein [Candidatus Eisenbacteria bacterium]
MSNEDRETYQLLARWAGEGRSFVLATVIRATGSTPRVAGTKMLIPSEGQGVGTVGGGVTEREVIDRARRLLRTGGPAEVVEISLADETACGGRMAIFLEPHLAEKQLVLFGAGHVGRAVAKLLADLGWDVTVIDPRAERLDDPDFARCRTRAEEYVAAAGALPFSPDLFVLVMTPDHQWDAQVAAACLEHPWRWLGVLGSARKAGQIRRHLAERGFSPEAIARLRIPVGVEIGSETPAEIAVSIAGELIRETSAKLAKASKHADAAPREESARQ